MLHVSSEPVEDHRYLIHQMTSRQLQASPGYPGVCRVNEVWLVQCYIAVEIASILRSEVSYYVYQR